MDKNVLYKEALNLLSHIELAVKDKEDFKIIRKKTLDLANDILKLEGGVEDGK